MKDQRFDFHVSCAVKLQIPFRRCDGPVISRKHINERIGGRVRPANITISAGVSVHPRAVIGHRLGGWDGNRVIMIHKRLSELASRVIQRLAIVDDVSAHVLLRQQKEHAFKETGTAAVPEHPLPVALPFHETIGHARQPWIVRELLAVHRLRRRRLQNARVAITAVLKMRGHKLGNVGDGRSQTHNRCRGEILVQRERLSHALVMPQRQVRPPRLRHRLPDGGAGHRQRFEQVFLDILLVRDPRHLLDNVPGQRRAVIRIRNDRPRR